MINEDTLRSWAQELGFSQLALCSADDFDDAFRIVRTQAPLNERKQLRFFPGSDDDRIKSIAVLLWPYAPAPEAQGDSVFVDSYYAASNLAYHAAKKLESRLLDAGCFAKANAPYPAKEAAMRAGLGIIGKNSLLITPAYGSRVVIILMATDLPCDRPDHGHHERNSCLNCGKCAEACPSGAITDEGMVHPERCLRNFMMEGVVMPEHLRESVGMRLTGCDICQCVCPMQPSLLPAEANQYALEQFLTLDQAVFSQTVGLLSTEIGRNAARPQRIRAQAALLAGNSGNSAYLPVLRQWAKSPFEAICVHASWAIGRIEYLSREQDFMNESHD